MYNLSFSQEEMYSIGAFFENTSVNNISMILKLKNKIEYSVLNDVLNKLVENNDSFRIKLNITNGLVKQSISEYSFCNYDIISCSNEDELLKSADELLNKPLFSYGNFLYKFIIAYDESEDKNHIFISMDHLITDAWTMLLVAKNIFEQLRGNVSDSSEKTISYLTLLDDEK